MKTYQILSLAEVIDLLRSLPEGSTVVGIDGLLHSDRGYYIRSASSPYPWPKDAHDLAKDLQNQIGKPTVGWKGGDFTVSADLPVHVGEYGDTGPAIAGVEKTGENSYEFFGISETWF